MSAARIETIPLDADASGTLRMVGSRVTLETLAVTWQGGATPEQIVDQFPGLNLSDVYAVITWMLRNPRELSDYLGQQEIAAEATRMKIDCTTGVKDLRAMLLARRSTK